MQDVLVANGLDTYKSILPMVLYLLSFFGLISFFKVSGFWNFSYHVKLIFESVNMCVHAHMCTFPMKKKLIMITPEL